MGNYYEVLQVDRRASPEVIKAAHRALVQLYRIGTNEGDKEIAIAINEAYAVLGNKDKRTAYDGTRENLQGLEVGPYIVLEHIASGAIGDTYRGVHKLLNEPVCIKHCANISTTAEAILMAETKAVWDLRHYALPTMRDFIKLVDGTAAIVMSYIPGPTLAQIVEKNGKLEAEHVAWIAERVLNGLSYMHNFGRVVHGDLKPQNIIVQPTEHMAVLVDFGLAMKNPTSNSRSIGYTDVFSPPEQRAKAGVPLVPGSDFCSLGSTMIFALTGDVKRVERRQIPADVPEPLAQFIQKLVRQNVLDRPKWHEEDLCDTIRQVRIQSFGRHRSNMKPIPNFS